MKKISWLIIVCSLVFVFLLCACKKINLPSNADISNQATDNNKTDNENKTSLGADESCQHNFSEWVTVKEATCKNEGETTRTCDKCAKLEKKTLPINGKHNVISDKAVPATCTSTGLTEGSHCSVCNEILTKQETIPMLAHSPVIDAAIPATCKDTGLTEGSHCAICNGIIIKQKTTRKTDVHTPGKKQNGIVSCTICNKVLEDHNRYTVTFKLGDTVLKSTSLKPGVTLTEPTPGADMWYIWNKSVPSKMPSQNIEFSVTAIAGITQSNHIWNYDYNGTLSIHGKGPLCDFSVDFQPWTEFRSEITSIVFGDTVSQIGTFAFCSCVNLTKVVIPDSIKRIGDFAFAGCLSIKEITIGSGVTYIGTQAFASSSLLQSIEMSGPINWTAHWDNCYANVTFSASDKISNAIIFKNYSSASFTAS